MAERVVMERMYSVRRVLPQPLPPPTFASFAFGTQVDREVQIDFGALDFAAAQEKANQVENQPLTLDANIYLSVVVSERAARNLHEFLTLAINNWNAEPAAGKGPGEAAK